MRRKFKRLLLCGDFHSGHRVGLTPPSWQDPHMALSTHSDAKYYKASIALWNEFASKIDALRPFDIAIFNGDLIDGKGFRSGGTELITTDRNKQCEIAIEAINYVKADANVIIRGTAYHTGSGEDYEDNIAREIKANKIGDHEWIDVNGVVFDVKHSVSSSSVPHSRGTAISKERLWNVIWHIDENDPKSDVIIRSHVHYHHFSGEPTWLAMTLPALQGKGSKFGKRICSGTVHFGFVWFDIFENGDYTWNSHIVKVAEQQAEILKF